MSVNFKAEALQKHKPLSDKIKESLEVQGTTVKEKESHGAYFENLPEGLEKKHVEDLSKYNGKFVAAAHVAIGEIAADVFNTNADAQRVDAKVAFFGKRDEMDVTVLRNKTYRNNFAENEADKELTKHLVMNSSVNVSGYGLKSVREAMSEEFKDTFAK